MVNGVDGKIWITSEEALSIRGAGTMGIDEFDDLVKELVPDHEERSISISFDHHEEEWLAQLSPRS